MRALAGRDARSCYFCPLFVGQPWTSANTAHDDLEEAMENAVIQHVRLDAGQLVTSSSRLSLASDDHSVTEPVGSRPKRLKAPLPLYAAVPVFHHQNAGPADTQSVSQRSRGADMAERTRGSSPTNSGTGVSGVNITPPTHAAPVTTTQLTR